MCTAVAPAGRRPHLASALRFQSRWRRRKASAADSSASAAHDTARFLLLLPLQPLATLRELRRKLRTVVFVRRRDVHGSRIPKRRYAIRVWGESSFQHRQQITNKRCSTSYVRSLRFVYLGYHADDSAWLRRLLGSSTTTTTLRLCDRRPAALQQRRTAFSASSRLHPPPPKPLRRGFETLCN